MSDFTKLYVDLLIKQYWEKPNAKAEIELQSTSWELVRDGFAAFGDAFDLDKAIGAQLDIIGSIVGLNRRVPNVTPFDKIAFGFDDNSNSRTFGDRFVTIAGAGLFADRFEPDRTAIELNDADYRLFISAKISSNIGSAFLVSDNRISIQEVISQVFDNLAYVVDQKNMTLVLYVSTVFDLDRLTAIQELGLLPKPQGVRYAHIIQSNPGSTFGFSDNVNNLGFGDRFDSGIVGGTFANRVI